MKIEQTKKDKKRQMTMKAYLEVEQTEKRKE